jgi:5-methylcytosine-specific restriction endonuclease McrA
MPKKVPVHRPRTFGRPGDQRRQYDRTPQRAEANAFYWSPRWRKLSAQYKRENPLCVMCNAEGFIVAAEVTDHIIPRDVDPSLEWEWSNFRSLCHHHHNKVRAEQNAEKARRRPIG